MSSEKINKDKILKEINEGEEIIKNEINKNTNSVENGSRKYGLLDTKWLDKYLIFLKSLNDDKTEKISYKYKEMKPNLDERDYSYIKESMRFFFPINFSFVKKDVMLVISEFCSEKKDKKEIQNYFFGIIIGGGCIIMNDLKGRKYPFNYIILYEERKGNKNNNIDYILKIDDKKERIDACNYILKNNIWNYIKKVEFKEEDEYKEIFDNKKNNIGYIVRNGTIERIEELKKFEKEKINNIPNEKKRNKSATKFSSIKNYFNSKSSVDKNTKNFNNINNFNNMNNFINYNQPNNFNNNINNQNNNYNNNFLINQINQSYNNNMNNINQFNNIFGNNNNINNHFNNNLIPYNSKDNKISELTKSNEELKNIIIKLEIELNKEKEKNHNFNNKINDLQTKLDSIDKKCKEKEHDIKVLNEKIKTFEDYSNKDLGLKKFIELMDKLNDLKSKMPFELNEGEKLMTVIFTSTKQDNLRSFICKNTDKFSRLENLLYEIEEYKEYKKVENYFLAHGKKINRYETLEENGIKNSDLITLVKIVEEE